MRNDPQPLGADPFRSHQPIQFDVIPPTPDNQSGSRAIVPGEHSWAPKDRTGGWIPFQQPHPGNQCNLIRPDDPRAQDPWRSTGHVHHRALDPHVAVASINDQPNPSTQSRGHVGGGRRGQLVRKVGARCSQGKSTGPDDGLHQGMERPTDTHRLPTRSDDIRNAITPRNHQSQRSRPEACRKTCRHLRPFAGALDCPVSIGNMNDQRVRCRPSLDLEDPSDRPGIVGIGGKPVDGLRRQRHDFPSLQRGTGTAHCRLEQSRSVDGEDLNRHRGITAPQRP